jgi:hypothetical protein
MANLRNGSTTSCGCFRREVTAETNRQTKRTHGLKQHYLYNTWVQMLERCENSQRKNFWDYGGRGITVCERWHDVRLYIEDIEAEIGSRPDGRYPSERFMYTVDRKDNDGNYESGNVQWASASQQSLNQRPKRG